MNIEQLISAYETLKKYANLLPADSEWTFQEATYSFRNGPSSYRINMIFDKDSSETAASAAQYLNDNSSLLSHFSHQNFDLNTPLFSACSYLTSNERVIDFRPKKMNVHHSTIWGADVLSDEPIPEFMDGEKLTEFGRLLLDLKMKVDRWDTVTGYFIICDGVAYSYPMNECKDDMKRAMANANAEIVDFYSAPINL